MLDDFISLDMWLTDTYKKSIPGSIPVTHNHYIYTPPTIPTYFSLFF